MLLALTAELANELTRVNTPQEHRDQTERDSDRPGTSQQGIHFAAHGDLMDREILVVEDDAETLDLITIILERQGYRVVVARDGRTGLEAVASRKPDLIITDIRMRNIDGIEMIKRIRAMGPMRRFIPVLAVTAYQLEHAAQAIEAGASRVLGKPIKDDLLLSCVRDLLGLGSTRAASATD